jgi:hypothetical protein
VLPLDCAELPVVVRFVRHVDDRQLNDAAIAPGYILGHGGDMCGRAGFHDRHAT